MEFCNRNCGDGNLEMEFFNGVAIENLELNSLKGAMAIEIPKWSSVMGWQRKF